MSRVVAAATRQVPRLGVGRGNLTSQPPTSAFYLPVPRVPILYIQYIQYIQYMLYFIYHIVLYSIVSFPYQLSIYLRQVCQVCQPGMEYMLFEEVILLLLKKSFFSIFSFPALSCQAIFFEILCRAHNVIDPQGWLRKPNHLLTTSKTSNHRALSHITALVAANSVKALHISKYLAI